MTCPVKSLFIHIHTSGASGTERRQRKIQLKKENGTTAACDNTRLKKQSNKKMTTKNK